MIIALFSDIHASLPALESFFKDVESRKPDVIYCLGDLVGYNVWPNEVIEEIRERHIPVIAGNYDDGIGKTSDDCGCAYKTDVEKEMGKISISYTNSVIGEDERAWLRSLPSHIRIEFPSMDGKLNLLLVHGSPRKINEYLFEDRDEKSLLKILEQANADILCFGHTHLPYHRVLESNVNGKTIVRHAINIGSVGKPKDGNPQGGYVLLHIDQRTNRLDSESIQVEFVRFEYDVQRAATAIESSPLPGAYADMLRKAY